MKLLPMEIMSELTSALTYFANKYINKEIDRYIPIKQQEAEKEVGSTTPPFLSKFSY